MTITIRHLASFTSDDHFAIAQDISINSSRLFNGTNQYEGQLQLRINGTWRPVCYSSINSITGNRLCRSVGFTIAVRSFEYPYNGVDAIFDQISCYTSFGRSRNLSDCYTTTHTPDQRCSTSTTLGLVCSDGQSC